MARRAGKRPPTVPIIREPTPNLTSELNAPSTPSTQLDPASRQLLQESRRASQTDPSAALRPGKSSGGKLIKPGHDRRPSPDGVAGSQARANPRRPRDAYEFEDARTPASPADDEDSSTAPSPAILIGSTTDAPDLFYKIDGPKRKPLADSDVGDIKKWSKGPRNGGRPGMHTRGKSKLKDTVEKDHASPPPNLTTLKTSSVTLNAPSNGTRSGQSPELSNTEYLSNQPRLSAQQPADEADAVAGVEDTDQDSVADRNGVRGKTARKRSTDAAQEDIIEDENDAQISEPPRAKRKKQNAKQNRVQEAFTTSATTEIVTKKPRGRPPKVRREKTPEIATPEPVDEAQEEVPSPSSEAYEPDATILDDEVSKQAENEIEDIEDIEVENWDTLPIYGQGIKLFTTFKASKIYRLDETRSNYWTRRQGGGLKPTKKLLPPIKTLYRLCQTYIEQIDRAKEFAADGGQIAPIDVDEASPLEIVMKFDNLLKLTKSLHVETYQPTETATDADLTKQRKILTRQIYIYAIPMLTDVLEATVNYNHRFTWAQNIQKLGLEDLSALYELICVVVGLDDHNKVWADSLKPSSKQQFPAVKDLRDGVIGPLRQIKVVFGQEVRHLSREKAVADAQAQSRALRIQVSQAQGQPRLSLAELRRKEQREHKDRRLRALVMARMLAEPDVRIRLDHHRYLGPSIAEPPRNGHSTNRDANGESFERVSMFGQSQRAQPEPRYVLRDGEEAWTDEEQSVLLEALDFYAGPDLWPQIIAKHCRYRGVLRYRTLSEMLRYAAYMRATFMRRDAEASANSIEDVVTEDWIVGIPDLDLVELL